MKPNTSGMILIPGGIFLMGSEQGNSNEVPVHEVEVSPFYLDQYVVTNREYREFVLANPQWRKGQAGPPNVDKDYLNLWEGTEYPAELADFSVINVSWYAATAYAEWLSKRLPTEAEWEFAAGGKEHFKWSLGNDFDSRLYSFGYTTDPVGFRVGSYPPNSYGLYEMSGGVWEWALDSYEVDAYQRGVRDNPLNRVESGRKSLRGGSCHFDNPSYLRCAVRGSNDPDACHEDYGIRCALTYQGPESREEPWG